MIAFETLLVLGITLAGVGVVCTWWRGSTVGAALLSAPIGAAVYALSGLALLAIGAYSTIGAVVMALAFGLAALVVRLLVRSESPPHRDVLRVAALASGWALIFVAISFVTTFTRMTPDSIDYLNIAGGLERFGEFPDLKAEEILKRQFVTAALQTGGVITGRGYLGSIIALLVGSGLAFSIWLGATSLLRLGVARNRIALAAGVVGAFVISTNRVLYHLFYLNGHGVFATFLVVGIGLLWYAAVTDRWFVAPIAAVALAGIVPLRAEGIVVLVFFLLPTLVASRTPASARWLLVVPAAAVALVWNAVVLRSILPSSEFGLMSTPTVTVVVALALLAVVAASSIERLTGLTRFIPVGAFAVLSLYTAARIYRGPSLFYDTMEAMGANLASAGLWGTFWWFAPLIVAVSIATVRIPSQNRMLWGLAAYPIVLLASSYLRGSAYRLGPGDSANRMLMHVVFVLAVYLVVALGVLASRVADSEFTVRSGLRSLVRAVSVD